MNLLSRIRKQGSTSITRFLAAWFFIQSMLLPFASHAVPTQAEDGTWMVLCTLQGNKLVQAGDSDTTGQQSNVSASCPACFLSASLETTIFNSFVTEVSANNEESLFSAENYNSIQIDLVSFRLIRAPPTK